MVEWITWGRATVYLSLLITAYFGIKALWEIHKHQRGHFEGCHHHSHIDAEKHKNNHIVYLLLGFCLAFMTIFAYTWFDIKDTGLGEDDRTIGVFLILIINGYLAFTINHFKAERTGKSETGKWKELFKF